MLFWIILFFLILGLLGSLYSLRVKHGFIKQIQEPENENLVRKMKEFRQIAETCKAQTILYKKIKAMRENRNTTREDFVDLLPVCRWQDQVYNNMLELEEAQKDPELTGLIGAEDLVKSIIRSARFSDDED